MSELSTLIGKQVISLDGGLGQVTGFDDLGMEDENFLVIEYGKDRTKSYINVEGRKNFRELLSQDQFISLLDKVLQKEYAEAIEFESKQERINYFKSESKKEDVELLLKLLSHLHGFDDLGAVEVQIFDRVVSSLALELSIITHDDTEKTKERILEVIKG